jgi:hypothetical protein
MKTNHFENSSFRNFLGVAQEMASLNDFLVFLLIFLSIFLLIFVCYCILRRNRHFEFSDEEREQMKAYHFRRSPSPGAKKTELTGMGAGGDEDVEFDAKQVEQLKILERVGNHLNIASPIAAAAVPVAAPVGFGDYNDDDFEDHDPEIAKLEKMLEKHDFNLQDDSRVAAGLSPGQRRPR